MKKILCVLLLLTVILLMFPDSSHAGPWTLKKGKLWMESYTKYFLSKEYFDPKGKKHRWGDGGFSEIWTEEVKFEYGINDKLNVRLAIPYNWSRWKNDWGKIRGSWGKFKNEGFGHIGIGAKYKYMDKPITAAAWVQVLLQPRGLDRNQQPDLIEFGDGIEARGLFGKSFHINKRPTYVATELGYLWRSDWISKSFYANQFIIFGEAGFAPLDWLMLKGEIDVRLSHEGTGVRKDTLTWRAGPIFSILGQGFSSVKKGGESSLNVEFQYGQTAWGRGDGSSERYATVSKAQEFVVKVQVLF